MIISRLANIEHVLSRLESALSSTKAIIISWLIPFTKNMFDVDLTIDHAAQAAVIVYYIISSVVLLRKAIRDRNIKRGFNEKDI